MTYSIGEIAKMMEMEPSTLRYYNQMGIFPNIKRVSGRRVFTNEDFKRLRVLKFMKKHLELFQVLVQCLRTK